MCRIAAGCLRPPFLQRDLRNQILSNIHQGFPLYKILYALVKAHCNKLELSFALTKL